MKFAVLILAILIACQANAQVIVVSIAPIEPPKLVEKPKPRAKQKRAVPIAPTLDFQLLNAHNYARERFRLRPFRINGRLTAAARSHATWMASRGQLTHMPNGVNPWVRIRQAGYDYSTYDDANENIAEFGWNNQDAVFATQAWLDSTVGHRDNVLSPRFTEVGFGMARSRRGWTYYCAAYGRPRTHL